MARVMNCFARFTAWSKSQPRARCRRDGRRISAAGAVGADAFDERRAQKQFRPAIKKNVHGLAPAAQVAAFDQRGAAKACVNCAGGGAQIFDRRQFASGENFGFVQRFGVTRWRAAAIFPSRS